MQCSSQQRSNIITTFTWLVSSTHSSGKVLNRLELGIFALDNKHHSLLAFEIKRNTKIMSRASYLREQHNTNKLASFIDDVVSIKTVTMKLIIVCLKIISFVAIKKG